MSKLKKGDMVALVTNGGYIGEEFLEGSVGQVVEVATPRGCIVDVGYVNDLLFHNQEIVKIGTL